jgi:L-threonylcarbamoyladenylate synthase
MVTTDVGRAAEVLRAGGIVAIPTETVYGLAGNGFDEGVVRRIFEAKQRPATNPLILHVGRREDVERLTTGVPELARGLMDAFWPGPLTVLLERSALVPDAVTAGGPRVAVRMPAAPLALELLQLLDFPLAAPSANPYTYVSPTRAEHVVASLGPRVDLVLDGGPCSYGLESTVVAVETGPDGRDAVVLYRPGAVTAEALTAFLAGRAPLLRHLPDAAAPAASPGLAALHYSPRTPVTLISDWGVATDPSARRPGFLAYRALPAGLPAGPTARILSPTGDPAEAARNLYDALIALDAAGCDRLFVELPPDEDLGAVMRERLGRMGREGEGTD